MIPVASADSKLARLLRGYRVALALHALHVQLADAACRTIKWSLEFVEQVVVACIRQLPPHVQDALLAVELEAMRQQDGAPPPPRN